jgi:hypothetical protein
MVRREHDPMSGIKRSPQPIYVSAFVIDDSMFVAKQRFVFSKPRQQSLRPMPSEWWSELIGFLN